MVKDKPVDPASVTAVVRLLELADPKGKFQRLRQPPVPVLHSDEQCCTCESVGVEKYCSACFELMTIDVVCICSTQRLIIQ